MAKNKESGEGSSKKQSQPKTYKKTSSGMRKERRLYQHLRKIVRHAVRANANSVRIYMDQCALAAYKRITGKDFSYVPSGTTDPDKILEFFNLKKPSRAVGAES